MVNENLTTVPTFNFSQGDFGESEWEQLLTVRYYRNNIIEIEQDGQAITLNINQVQRLATMIKKYNLEAQAKLKG